MMRINDATAQLVAWCEDHDLDPSDYDRAARDNADGTVTLWRYKRHDDWTIVIDQHNPVRIPVTVQCHRPFPFAALNRVLKPSP